MYCPLWVKSNYSFLEGASHPDELVETASQFGIGKVAITDTNGLYGAARMHIAAKQHEMKLILGAELSVSSGHTICLLATSQAGYQTLCQLITRGQLRSSKGDFVLYWEDVYSHNRDLLLLCPSTNSPLARDTYVKKVATRLREAFAGRMYALISRHKQPDDLEKERFIRERTKELEILPVACNETLYHHHSRAPLQHIVTAIKHRTSLLRAGTLLRPNSEHGLLSPERFASLFSDCTEDVTRTLAIAEQCTFTLADINYKYPLENLPTGMSSSGWLRQLTIQGAKQRYGQDIPEVAMAQIEKELSLVEELDYGGYFLTMHEIVSFCQDNNILCQGRGSAANSIVCYCLGITAIDPIQMKLLFERFISRERAEPPDIDLDIEHDKREIVIQHVYRKYGRSRAAMVANVVRYRARSAIREVGKALDIPEALLDRTAKLASHYDILNMEAAAKLGIDVSNQKLELLFTYASQIQDFPRHLSIHPGGFVLGDQPVHNLVPIENASMEGRTIIQWDKEDLEELGLFKVDLLGLGALSVVHHTLDLIKHHRARTLSLRSIPHGDSDTYDMICRADTVGLFQIESRAQMSMLPRLRPRYFYDLVVEISLVRPGPISGGMVHPYLRRRAGLEEVTYPHECLKPVLEKTLGVPLFQEQVMKLAIVAADYTPGEADQLRRDMAAWRRSGRIEKHRDRLVNRMMQKGISQEFAERVFEQIRGFGEYGFPESHAASFALIAYATAWLRCHYMAEYTCGLLNAQPMGFYSPSTIIFDAMRHGIEFRPIDVNLSSWQCTLEPTQQKNNQTERTYAIRMGLRYIKGLSESLHGSKILAARQTQAFSSVHDFCRRTNIDRLALGKLSQAGAFCKFDGNRRNVLWQTRAFASQEKLDTSHSKQKASFKDLAYDKIVSWDYMAGNHSTHGHPLQPLRATLKAQGLPDASAVNRMSNRQKCDYAGMVICRQRPGTAGGVVFMTLEDETGFVNLVVWEKVFRAYEIIAKTCAFLGVSGTMQVQESIVHLIADKLWQPSEKIVSLQSRDFH